MVEYEIDYINRRYDELYEKLTNAAYQLLDVNPVSYLIDVDIRLYKAFDIWFKICPRDICDGKYTLRSIPTDVIDKFYEANRDAAMQRWEQIKRQRAESKRIEAELHKQLDFTGVEGTKHEQNP
jgi:hypothetical protein